MSVFVRKLVGKRPLAKPRHIKLYYYIIKMYLEAAEWGFMDWIRLDYDTDK